jgi:hypothetical protein
MRSVGTWRPTIAHAGPSRGVTSPTQPNPCDCIATAHPRRRRPRPTPCSGIVSGEATRDTHPLDCRTGWHRPRPHERPDRVPRPVHRRTRRMADRPPVPCLCRCAGEGDPMNGNRRALRVLAITSRRRPMHGYAAPLCSLSIVCVFAQVAMSMVDAPAEGLDHRFVRRVGYPHAISKARRTAPALSVRTAEFSSVGGRTATSPDRPMPLSGRPGPP